MNNGEEVGQRRVRRIVYCSGIVLVVMLMMIFTLLYETAKASQRERVESLSSSTTTITSNREVLLTATLTPLQTAQFLDRLNDLIAVNSNSDIARGLTQVFPRNVSGYYLGEWDYLTATGNEGNGNPRMFPWNEARQGSFMVCQILSLIPTQTLVLRTILHIPFLTHCASTNIHTLIKPLPR